ncbi:MAG: hypothetical protein EOP04_20535 [Proteobacteria bacterium]|nr:MAG: hypothetical protein EOP04_20535 [Pseudomonadota bacterium]
MKRQTKAKAVHGLLIKMKPSHHVKILTFAEMIGTTEENIQAIIKKKGLRVLYSDFRSYPPSDVSPITGQAFEPIYLMRDGAFGLIDEVLTPVTKVVRVLLRVKAGSSGSKPTDGRNLELIS